MTNKSDFGEIVQDDPSIFKRPLYEVDIKLLSAMRTEANLSHNMSKHKQFSDQLILEQKRKLELEIENLHCIAKELDKKYNVE